MQINPQLLEKYHLDLCTPDEKKLVALWLADEHTLEDFEKDTSLHHLKEEADRNMRLFLEQKTGVWLSGRAPLHSGKSTFYRYGIAAAVLLFGLLAGIWFQYEATGQPIALVRKEIRIPYGKKGKVTLSDGTSIYLNSGSVLSYPERFDDSIRQVSLTGEAFFKVAPDPLHPFVVTSLHHTQVRVLGTAFNIRAYPNETYVGVNVEEGKVKFLNTNNNTAQILLTAGQSASYSDQTREIKQDVIETPPATYAWKNNELNFQGEKLNDIVKKLERWYDVKIQVDNVQLASLKYSGNYVNPELHQLLKSMGFVMGFNYKMNKGDTVITIY